MTDKPTDEIERRAEEYCKSVGDDCLCQRTRPGTPVGECIYCFCGCSIHEAFLAGHSAAKEKVEGLRALLHEREIECVLKTDRITALEAERAELVRTYHGYRAESIELKDEVRVLRDHNKELDEWNFTHRVKVESLKTAQKELVEALGWILDLGKRDLSNPKYDSVFVESKEILARHRKVGE